jgi:hypothetical protein
VADAARSRVVALPDPRMQPTGRPVPGSARALIAGGDHWNRGWCEHRFESTLLMRQSLGRATYTLSGLVGV